jgi:hypothetical protein
MTPMRSGKAKAKRTDSTLPTFVNPMYNLLTKVLVRIAAYDPSSLWKEPFTWFEIN